jgi:hypothetical protein
MIENLCSLNEDLNIPSKIADRGVHEADLYRLVEVVSRVARLLGNDPKFMSISDCGRPTAGCSRGSPAPLIDPQGGLSLFKSVHRCAEDYFETVLCLMKG